LTELVEGYSDWIVKQRKQFRTMNESIIKAWNDCTQGDGVEVVGEALKSGRKSAIYPRIAIPELNVGRRRRQFGSGKQSAQWMGPPESPNNIRGVVGNPQ